MNDLSYTDTPTRIRVLCEDEHWMIDGADDDGNFTEAVWDHYDGQQMTRDQAITHTREFAETHGWGDLPIVEFSMGDPDVLLDA